MAVRNSSTHLPRWSVQDQLFKASTVSESELEEDGIKTEYSKSETEGESVWVSNKIEAWKY